MYNKIRIFQSGSSGIPQSLLNVTQMQQVVAQLPLGKCCLGMHSEIQEESIENDHINLLKKTTYSLEKLNLLHSIFIC